jgi:uncharacterized protein
MLVAILSDIHDNVWKLDAALARAAAADALVCCGDLCSPFVIHQLGRGFAKPIHIVFGNNDGDRFLMAANAARHPHLHLHGEIFKNEFDGRQFAVNHYDQIARTLAAAGEFDVVCYGHNHIFEIARVDRTLAINPGALMGATFGREAARTDIASTFVFYDTEKDTAERVEV